MKYYIEVDLPNRPTKQQLIDNFYKEQQALVEQEMDVELCNRAIAERVYIYILVNFRR